MMKIWKRNAIVAAVLVLVCAGIYLNWRYEEGLKVDLVSTLDSDKVLNDAALVMQTDGEALEALAGADLPASPAADQFARLRLSRQTEQEAQQRGHAPEDKERDREHEAGFLLCAEHEHGYTEPERKADKA